MNEDTRPENHETKQKELFRNQKQLLDTFLEHGRRADDRQWRKSRRV